MAVREEAVGRALYGVTSSASRLAASEKTVSRMEWLAGIEPDRGKRVLVRRPDGFCRDGRRLGV